DLAYRARLVATGSERVDFLQGMLTTDVRRLGDGDGAAALLLTEQGRVVADLIVLVTADAVILDARAEATARTKEALERYIVADAGEMPARGATVVVDGKDVGRVTSVAWSWRLARPVALAYVRREHVAAGTAVEVRVVSGTVRATVSESPIG